MSPTFRNPLIDGLPPDSLVLDIGCGTGHHAHELARAGHRVVAVDVDFDAIATGRELGESVGRPGTARFLAARAEGLPFRATTFEAVVCLDVLHWSVGTAHFEAMWNEAWRVLKGEGLFHIRCLLRDALPSALPIEDGRYRLESGATWFLPARAQLEALLAQSGGIWLLPPAADAQGAARMTARKPALH